MDTKILIETVSKLVAKPKGILAIDESISTCDARFEKLGIPTTEEKRRDYREILVTAPDIEKYVSGYITFDETIRQSTKENILFSKILKEKGILVGIKVDQGLKDFPDSPIEKMTIGLEGLTERLQEYKNFGASFAKWREAITIGDGLPTEECLITNAQSLAKYAKLCQDENIVPMVEPEVLIDGNHSIEKCFEVTAHNLDILFTELKKENVFLPGIILKTSMVLAGKDHFPQAGIDQVAEQTLKCLKEHVPLDIGGIVFLSGGQDDETSVLHLNAMHQTGELPWPLTFSYGRAIQNDTLLSFAKNPEDTESAQKLLVENAEKCSMASIGKYT